MLKTQKKNMGTFKERYNNNPVFRAKQKAYMRESVTCQCGMEMRRYNLSNHRKTQRHKDNMKLIEKTKTESKELIKFRDEQIEEIKAQMAVLQALIEVL